MQIGIIELTCLNHEVVDTCKMANPSKNEVTLFITEELKDAIVKELNEYATLINIVIKKKNDSFYSFITKINKTCYQNNIDFLLVNTISRWELLFLKKRAITVCYLYSLNFWFKDLKNKQSSFKLFNRLNLLSFFPIRWIANPIFGRVIRKNILHKMDGILVEYPLFIETIKNKFNYKKDVYFLPKRHYEGPIEFNTEKIVFTITGTIAKIRRNYDVVLNAISNIHEEYRGKFKLILLGKPIGKYGNQIIDRCRKLISKGYEIDYSETYISSDVMLEKLKTTSLMISPMNINYESGIIKERFTYTKGTGTFNDALRFGLPTIVPSDYQIDKEFADCFLRYNSAGELYEIILQLITNKGELKKIRDATDALMKQYTLIECQNKFKNIQSSFVQKS